MDLGYGDHEPALMLTHWKFYLRAITNAILDVEIHTRGMTEEQAIDLMVGQGFQEEDEARAKWLRARLDLDPALDLLPRHDRDVDLEVEARIRAAVAAGLGRRDVPAQRVRRRHRRDARLRLPHAPRVGHLPRHAAHPLGAPHPRRRGRLTGLPAAAWLARAGPAAEPATARQAGARRPTTRMSPTHPRPSGSLLPTRWVDRDT